MTLAYLPRLAGVDLRLTVARRCAPDDAERALDDAAARAARRRGSRLRRGDDDLAAVVLDLCRARGLTIGVAESCTGGLLGARLTAIPGSSDVVHGGVIAYDNDVKTKLLGVSDASLSEHGAVSEQVAREMAEGCARALGTTIGLAITGVAGPAADGGEARRHRLDRRRTASARRARSGAAYVGDREEIGSARRRHRSTRCRRAIARAHVRRVRLSCRCPAGQNDGNYGMTRRASSTRKDGTREG